MTGRRLNFSCLSLLAFLPFLILFSPSRNAMAAGPGEKTLTVAVASNALRPVEEIAASFENEHGIKLRIASGSTGKLYTQITQGAPFDIFIAADSEHPELLEKKGLIRPGSRFTYARGVLMVWTSNRETVLDGKDLGFLTDARVRRIAIANPATAPYGAAAIDALAAQGLLEKVSGKFVYGENVSHAFNFARTGNADVAITALSVAYGQGGRRAAVDASLHSPLLQQAVILRGAPAGAALFAEFLKSQTAAGVFKKYGYETQ